MNDDRGYRVDVPRKGTKKRKLPKEFHNILETQQWCKDKYEISNLLETQLKSIHTELQDSAVQDVVHFVSNYQYTADRIPVITLFTGFNLPDHNSVISQVIENLDSNKEINCQMVNLNPTKTSSLKNLIESVVYDFLNKENEDLSDEEDVNFVIVKSKCSLLRLTEWYLNNYGPLDELSETENDCQITHLVIVIQDVGLFPKQILNEFLSAISSFKDRLPFMFLMGVPYTLNFLEKRFTSKVYSKLAIYPFQSRPTVAFLDKVLEEVFISKNCIFHMGPDVFKTLCRSYMNYNFSVKEFIRGAKLCVLEHFSQSPAHATFCCDPKSNNISNRIDNLTNDDIIFILDLPSIQKYNKKLEMNKKSKLMVSSPTVKDELKQLYYQFKTNVMQFNAAVQCLNLLMKSLKDNTFVTPIQEIYLRVMDPNERKQWLDTNLMYINLSSKLPLLEALKEVEKMLDFYNESELPAIRLKLSKFIKRIEESRIDKPRRSPSGSPIKGITSPIKAARSPVKAVGSPIKAITSPIKTPKSCLKMTSPMKSIRSSGAANSPFAKVRSPLARRSLFKDDSTMVAADSSAKISPSVVSRALFKNDNSPFAGNSPSVKASPSIARRALFKDTLRTSAQKIKLQSEFVEAKNELLEFLRQDFFKLCLKSLDDIPLHELFIYNDYETIESLLDPIPRTAQNEALETPATYLQCECCKQNSRDEVLKTMPDISTVFKLHKECGNVINLYDWFLQFRTYVDKKTSNDDNISLEIYARFVEALEELRFLGYISLPKKKPNGKEFVNKYVYF